MRRQSRATYAWGSLIVSAMLLGGCALQPPFEHPAIEARGEWDNAAMSGNAPSSLDRDGWWKQLHDPAIDNLVNAGLADNPTLAEAAARVDRARALLASENGRKLPQIGAGASAAQSRDQSGAGRETSWQSAASAGLRLSWEIDLWGRLRESAAAAEHRLTARTGDAEGVRLAVIGDIADTAIALRACILTLAVRDSDLVSREAELRINRARLQLGAIAPVEVATTESNLALARTERISQEEACRFQLNALVALSGLEPDEVRALIALPLPNDTASTALAEAGMPDPPLFLPELPATILLGHPAVVAAEREAAARWSDIAVARAERLPRVDLLGILTGQWIRALGASSTSLTGSAGVQLAVPLFDGGSGAANVRVAEADHREALATLASTVRTVVRDIEDGLAAQSSAYRRTDTARDALEAADFTLRANEARLRAGAIAQYELEESRRLFNEARISSVTASSDRARSWVALVRRTGPDWGVSLDRTQAAAFDGSRVVEE